MCRQGYLIKHLKKNSAEIYYFRLEDGVLRYYTSSDSTDLVGEFHLSGCKIEVKAQKRSDGIPNSFYIQSRKVNLHERSYTLGPREVLELTAPSLSNRSEWGKALFTWQRHYFQDPADGDSSDTTQSDQIIKKILTNVLETAFGPKTNSSSFFFRTLSLKRIVSSASETASTPKVQDPAAFTKSQMKINAPPIVITSVPLAAQPSAVVT